MTGLGSFLGRRLAERLAAREGSAVFGLDTRRPWGLASSVEFRPIDLTHPATNALADVLGKEGIETVVHLAFSSEPGPDVEEQHELETIGSLNLIAACSAAGVRRFVLGSTTMVYGARPDNPNFLTEDHPLRGHPDAHGVANRVEVEQLLAEHARRHPQRELCVLRPCWIMGPDYWDDRVRHFSRPVVPTLLGYDPLVQFVHESDCLSAFEQAALGTQRGAFNVVGSGAMPLSTLIRIAGKRPLPVPSRLLYRIGSYPAQAQTGDRPEGFYDYLRYQWVADGRRGFEAFGEPRYTTREAWMSFVSSRRLRRYR